MTTKLSYQQPIDFFARRSHFVDHLAPVWQALDGMRGTFYVPEGIEAHARQLGIDARPLKALDPLAPLDVAPDAGNPLLIAAYGDLQRAYDRRPQRPFILMEHGVGLTPSDHSGYAGGTSLRRKVNLFLAPNEYIRNKTAGSLPAPQVVIGTPKLDEWAPWRQAHMMKPLNDWRNKPVVAISFHWNGSKISPEAGNAFEYYRKHLYSLAYRNEFTLIGHGHPRILDLLATHYDELGIEVVRDFNEVMCRADVYVNDCSSTMYEFIVTGKPVVILNAPQFRRDVKWGIRFWDYTDIGRQVNEPEELLATILWTLEHPDHYALQRYAAAQDLFPFLGHSAQRAAGAILGFCGGKQ